MRQCTKCKEEKDEAEFYSQRPPHTKLFKRCKDCCKNFNHKEASMRWRAKHIYGITLEEYYNLKDAAGRRCPYAWMRTSTCTWIITQSREK